ncbi:MULTISPECIES: acyltransferase [Cryobacterium]|uniref:acyltransferase family protein n=1 Tax=Cryobacterium TaxID=69578 RepID=UPI00106A1ACB|nr:MULTISPECIES: acyltransferase [Cryobacterium]TFB98002.1 acyltransferase [Cryobacterium sp. MDB2-A-1]TFC10936.1 acyltransferase [Cryobacterium sp. MDB2-A-2]TFC14413.1 acyltransferase [Cryobacterium sp. MDB2-10]
MPPEKSDVAPRQVGLTIAEALGGHRNSLGLLRLLLASLVIFDHAFPTGGFGRDPFWELTRGQASLGSIAVGGFFAISGYLIAKSGMSSDILQFMWRRSLRIFPAYWGVLLITAFVVAPVIWVTAGGALGDFFARAPNGPFHYVAGNWTMNIGTYGIYDIFAETTPYGQSVKASVFNGSIWTLIYEWRCYLVIGVCVAFGVLARAKAVVPALTVGFFVLQIINLSNPASLGSIAPFLADTQLVALTFTFLVGSTLAVYSRSVPFDDRLGVLAGLIVIVTLRYGAFNTLGIIAGAYFVLYLAARLPRRLQWIGARNDYSYGVYIYGFLVQQVLAYLGVYRWGYGWFALTALVISLGCAWLSWHGVEKWAMSLKNWGPGKGLVFWAAMVQGRWPGRKRIRSTVGADTTDRILDSETKRNAK